MTAAQELLCKVVDRELCAGCGACAGICPKSIFSMHLAPAGNYEPRAKHPELCCNCDQCIHACPFFREKDQTHWKSPTDDVNGIAYIQGYVENSEDRLTSASGGLTTWILSKLLQSGRVSRAWCVGPTGDPKCLFKYKRCTTRKEIGQCRGSAYYPVECSEVVRDLINDDTPAVIVGLPCVIKALRNSLSQRKDANKEGHIFVGLTCGQNISTAGTDSIAQDAGLTEATVSIRFRDKTNAQTAEEFRFLLTDQQGKQHALSSQEWFTPYWHDLWFALPGCHFCDDVFSRHADICLMDAWLPSVIEDPRGTNLAIVRTTELRNIILNGAQQKEISITTCKPEDIARSQQTVSYRKSVELKVRRKAWVRIYRDKSFLPYPARGTPSPSPFSQQIIKLRWWMNRTVRTACSQGRNDAKELHNQIAPIDKRLQFWKRLNSFTRKPPSI